MKRHLCAALAVLLLAGSPAFGEGQSPVSEAITFVVSTGFWEEPAENDDDTSAAKPETAETVKSAALRRGYYKLIAVRQPDGTAQIHLQQIEATAGGPKIASSTVLEEFSALKPYVTDIRPENSSGVTAQPGLFATVYLKTDPKAAEPESWTVLIDDLGEIRVERATN
ncbi:hypothetical protein MUO32_05770 [Shinella sp. CPCC 101442]|uniref:hypothetical protein n=1 Tax=Shinella sp. CPCC 101442 TaxID=2932265 RepID=UPI00215310B5|nr:hypothetical protein [Shinella sp. CPCC 101442]MCR6498531.1 hypothetical protein [Shinella sp. CPCC 101442]